jgi:hypothetical protein
VRLPAILLPAAIMLGGCTCAYWGTQPGAACPAALPTTWMIGVELVRDDVPPTAPFTNRLLADFAAMPHTQVLYLGSAQNEFLFSAYAGNKLRLGAWLHGDGACMTAIYTIYQAGVQMDRLGLRVPRLAAGTEPDSACVDRFATGFYQALVLQTDLPLVGPPVRPPG